MGNTLPIKARGVQLPIIKEIYEPVLKELETYGVKFKVQSLPTGQAGSKFEV